MVVELLLPETIQKVNEDMFLMPTVFGSLIVGRMRGQQSRVGLNFLFSAHTDPLQKMCSLDLVGLEGLHNSDIDDEQQAIKNFYDTVKFTEGRYSISWPWRAFPPNLDTNFGLALGRLKALHKKLRNSPQLLLEYHQIIQRQLEAKIIEMVDRREPASSVVHYVPHHPVLQPEKEMRPVYDGSSKPGKLKKSLNDNILKGKNWLNDLVKTLIRFRKHRKAVISDIAKAFHQIAINNEDRDAVRFIWLKDPLQQPTDENLQIYRFRRVAFGIVASPFILSATIQFHAGKQKPNDFTDIILRDMYADNLVAALPDEVDLPRFYSYAKELFAQMSMNLTKWSTNDEELRQIIPEEDQVLETVQSVLGLRWNTQKDILRFKNPKVQPAEVPTRRIVASEMAAYFDPMDWATPILLIAKAFFRKLWTETRNWDEPLQPVHRQEWAEIVKKLQKITCIELPRQLRMFLGQQQYQLHTFVDASAVAYAVVVYLRVHQEERTQLSIVAAKSRLTPLKSTTIPKLELIAILLGCRFTNFVRTTLELPQVTCFIWSDSKCALSWMRQDKILPTAIEKYINEAKTFKIENFRYVPSERNFADVATRGADFQNLVDTNWWTGPEWLYHEQDWPTVEEPATSERQISLVFQTQLMTKQNPPKEEDVEGICKIKIGNFSSLSRLLIRTAYILRAVIRLLKNNFLQLQSDLDTAFALKLLLRWDQNRYYALQGEPTAFKKCFLRNISVFRDGDGVIRCQTRLQNSFFELDAVTPILLVQNSTLTRLLILQVHTQNKHAGTNHTLAVLRQRYWLPQGRRQVYKTILNSCFVCRRHVTQAYPNPPAAPLPEFRVLRVQKPFQATGVDVFGPFAVRQQTTTGFQKEKRWMIIFTCATIRAIHLETITEMTTAEISYAFRRFFSRRGVPRKIISDNAPQFHVLDNHFRNLWYTIAKAPSVSDYFAENQIEWEFIPELAPWMGSIYERLIQSIKKAFEKTYGDKRLTNKQFDLAMIEIEAVVNSRPIAYIDRDPECPILTPNDFLSARFSAIPIKKTAQETDGALVKLWKSSQVYLDQFWEYWSTQYILLLRERNDQLGHRRSVAKQSPVKGDIVILQDLTKKRSSWQLAIVERMIASEDGEVRSVQIRIPNGARLIRPVISLAPLGLNADLPRVRDDQLTKRRDAIVIWPIEDISPENADQTHVNPDNVQNESVPPPPTQPDADQHRADVAGGDLHF